jgi:hypothetical protein
MLGLNEKNGSSSSEEAILYCLHYLSSHSRTPPNVDFMTLHFTKSKDLELTNWPLQRIQLLEYKNAAEEIIQWHFYVKQGANKNWYVRNWGGGKSGNENPLIENKPNVHVLSSYSNRSMSDDGEVFTFITSAVIDNNRWNVTFVRIKSSNGIILENRVEDTLVFFAHDHKLEQPFETELYSELGELLATYTLIW